MRSIGQVLKEARVKRKLSRGQLAEKTKIKKEFIVAIEKESWEDLPELPVVSGFVKNIAQALKEDKEQMAALLRRDYPPKSLRISPKPDVSEKFTWSPRLTFILGMIVVVLMILSYLGFQYINFQRPPRLEVSSPQEGAVISKELVVVEGKTTPSAAVVVNNQPVLVEEDGSFKAEVEVFEGTNELVVKATARSGKETVIHRKIKPEISD
jgi:cytoskeletal protein RodZ